MRLSISNLVPGVLRAQHNSYNATAWGSDRVFHQGEQVLVHGAAGSGKSLFLNMLYGTERNYTGKIYWGAYNLAESGSEQLSALRAATVSMVFQDLRLFDTLTVMENIDIKRRLTDTITEYDAEKWLDKIGLKPKLDVQVKKLSHGERQKAAIVRALVQPFEWLLLDAPFTYLDFYSRQKAISLIKEVCAYTGAGIIVSAESDNNDFVYDKKLSF